MDAISRKNLTRLLSQADQKPVCVFTDLDKTSCLEFNADYAAENKAETGKSGCYMQPDIRRALTSLPQTGSSYYIVTGRHWADVRINDVTSQKIPDGAFYDLLGGVKDFEKASGVAGHGRLLINNGETTVLRRSASPQDSFKEQKFERYVGERVLKLKTDIFKRWPETRGKILAEYKKHLSYINLSDFIKESPLVGKEVFEYVDTGMKQIMNGQNPDGTKDINAPENPNNALFYTVEPTGSMEIRSKNQSKRNGVEKSGFLEEAYKAGGPVIVMGDSLAKNGTDRDMVEAVRDYFQKKWALDRVFVIHVMNGEQNRITDRNDTCYPTISIKDPDELGQVMKMVAGHSRSRQEKETQINNLKMKNKNRGR